MKLLLHGLNFSPEEIGIGKYSGEMVTDLVDQGFEVSVVSTRPYYPQWKVREDYPGFGYKSESGENIQIVRCPLWVPSRVNGWKRIVHLASFGISSVPVMLWKARSTRPDVVMVIEPAMFCLPTSWLAAKLCGAKTWLHIQDFEVDAAFELGILRQPLLKKIVLALEAFMMRRFDRVTSISPKMVERASQKGVEKDRLGLFPNWVDCDVMQPLPNRTQLREQFGLPAEKVIALYAGNIGAKQGLEIVIETARRAAKREDLHFVICGHGAAFPAIELAARGLSNLQMLPVQPSEVFNELMNSADIHLLPQRADAADLVMPSKLTGMLATGIPVVACAGSGTQIEQVVAGHGLVVEPGDVEGFYNAILALADDEQFRKAAGDAARVYAIKHLGKRAILDDLACELSKLARPIEAAKPRRLSDLLKSYRFHIAASWLVLTLAVAAFAILKPQPNATELPFLPSFLSKWLDDNYDVRTFFLSLGIAVVPAIVMANDRDAGLRRTMLLTLAVLLVSLELAQFWLPDRRISVSDLVYSALGCMTAEILASCWSWVKLKITPALSDATG